MLVMRSLLPPSCCQQQQAIDASTAAAMDTLHSPACICSIAKCEWQKQPRAAVTLQPHTASHGMCAPAAAPHRAAAGELRQPHYVQPAAGPALCPRCRQDAPGARSHDRLGADGDIAPVGCAHKRGATPQMYTACAQQTCGGCGAQRGCRASAKMARATAPPAVPSAMPPMVPRQLAVHADSNVSQAPGPQTAAVKTGICLLCHSRCEPMQASCGSCSAPGHNRGAAGGSPQRRASHNVVITVQKVQQAEVRHAAGCLHWQRSLQNCKCVGHPTRKCCLQCLAQLQIRRTC